MFRKFGIALVVLSLAGCEQPVSTASHADPLIEGELDQKSYLKAAVVQVAATNQLMADSALTEAQLNTQISQLEQLLTLADQLTLDKALLQEAELMSSLGSLYARKALFYTNNAQQAGSFSARGFRYLDKAVSKYPDNVTARLNRGIVSARVPEFMNKAAIARSDLEFVLQSSEFTKFNPGLQQSVKQMLAEVSSRLATDV
ncbi:hypothetical protein [Rheinheimera maricola]|uniref:Uncharacterized protein n=1 Tax=Rheinheimera maricola TaxID=2793282 RepID=A0ABS7XC79_9GAMM|nr:hypothetical protein [Rheinheimera maricola]MBZ9613156.1 hypothetical protein [Rheinheimera maricola]